MVKARPGARLVIYETGDRKAAGEAAEAGLADVGAGEDGLMRADLVTPFGNGAAHGNFLSFRTPNAATIEAALAAVDVHADHRGDRMRFGFGLATTSEDVDTAIERMAQALARL